ncbi:hypothetical protein [Nocardia wallacei]|uniref:hypothetical protein n=1 Tax=Nocardia wallacei TaxID=480035 RepID=UPI002455536E|nr:hypothetical protein [Nocardia wallacei]
MKLRMATILVSAAVAGLGLAGAATAAPHPVQTDHHTAPAGCPTPPLGTDGKPLPPPLGTDGKPLPPPVGEDGKPCPPPLGPDGEPLPPPPGA